MRKLDIMEVPTSELFEWCEEAHGIHWNAAVELFRELIPYNSYEDCVRVLGGNDGDVDCRLSDAWEVWSAAWQKFKERM